MTKENLINKIQYAFKEVRLDNGIGIWEAQGLDNYASESEILSLRKKDERDDWNKITYQDLADCESSLSFFDAKGMRFCLPKFLIFDILEEQVFKEIGILSPDVLFTLAYEIDSEYHKKRFSLFNAKQVQSVVFFLEYKLQNTNLAPADYEYGELVKTLNEWKKKTL